MNNGIYVIVSLIIMFSATTVNYALIDEQAGSRTHSGGTVFVPSGGGFSSGSHK